MNPFSACRAAARFAVRRAALTLPGLVLLAGAAAHAQAVAPAAADSDDAGLRAIAALARVNGEALACHEAPAARRAKALMLAHAPKTARYGALYEEGTRQAYLALARSAGPCPDAAVFGARLDALATQLRTLLPPAAPAH